MILRQRVLLQHDSVSVLELDGNDGGTRVCRQLRRRRGSFVSRRCLRLRTEQLQAQVGRRRVRQLLPHELQQRRLDRRHLLADLGRLGVERHEHVGHVHRRRRRRGLQRRTRRRRDRRRCRRIAAWWSRCRRVSIVVRRRRCGYHAWCERGRPAWNLPWKCMRRHMHRDTCAQAHLQMHAYVSVCLHPCSSCIKACTKCAKAPMEAYAFACMREGVCICEGVSG